MIEGHKSWWETFLEHLIGHSYIVTSCMVGLHAESHPNSKIWDSWVKSIVMWKSLIYINDVFHFYSSFIVEKKCIKMINYFFIYKNVFVFGLSPWFQQLTSSKTHSVTQWYISLLIALECARQRATLRLPKLEIKRFYDEEAHESSTSTWPKSALPAFYVSPPPPHCTCAHLSIAWWGSSMLLLVVEIRL